MVEGTLDRNPPLVEETGKGNAKFIVGGVILLLAVAYLIVSNLITGQEYFMTVDELLASGETVMGRNIRVSGVVIGETISYDGYELSFDIAHIPTSAAELEEGGGLALMLHEAASDPTRQRVHVVLYDEPKPDLLQHEAQAIITGQLGEDGMFYADELLLKCPTRYEEAVPEQVEP